MCTYIYIYLYTHMYTCLYMYFFREKHGRSALPRLLTHGLRSGAAAVL